MNRETGGRHSRPAGDSGFVPDLLRVELSRSEKEVVVVLVGELDISTRQRVTDVLTELEPMPLSRLVIDLTHLSFVDSTGLAMFVALDKRCRENGGPTLEIRPGPPAVQRLFELVGAADRLPFTGGAGAL